MKQLLIVAHAPSPNTRRLVDAALKGAGHPDIEQVSVTWKPPLEAGPEDVLACDAILLGTTENLGYMSGALKDFFDRTYYAVIDDKQGLPCALYIAPAWTAPAPAGRWSPSSPACAGTGCRIRWCARASGRTPSPTRWKS